MARLIVASETFTPLSSPNASECSLSVKLGLATNCWGSRSPLKALPFTGALPGIFLVFTSPVSSRLLS
jgi:hypothetical protein